VRDTYPIISADSHITEAPNTYIDYKKAYFDAYNRWLKDLPIAA
jgi:hypothetical protein